MFKNGMEKYIIGEHTIEIRESSTGSFSPWHRESYEKNGVTNLLCTADMATFIKIDSDIYRIDRNRHLISEFMKQMKQLYIDKPGIVEEYIIFLRNNAIEEFILNKQAPIEECLKKINKNNIRL